MPFVQAGLRGHNFLEKNIDVFNNFLPKKYEGFRSSVVEQWSSNARPEHIYNSHYGNGVPAMFTS